MEHRTRSKEIPVFIHYSTARITSTIGKKSQSILGNAAGACIGRIREEHSCMEP